jgi:3-(3-hydroxy-phenyl)propionate hydroxylase
VLLHREADDVWRIDFQLGWDADPEEEKKPEKVIPRIQAMLGPEVSFELEWVSVYTFQCRRMARLDHGRVLFAGDSAHQVSPFGARGANSGIQDADNLMWKLALVIRGQAPSTLLHSYGTERGQAADENILNSTRSTDFITPKSRTSRAFRDATLQLAQHHAFARKLVNSGRLSVPTHYADSPLSTPPDAPHAGWMAPGAPMDDAPVVHEGQAGWLLQHLGGRFQLMVFLDERTTSSVLSALQVLSGRKLPVQAVLLSPTPVSPELAAHLQQLEALVLHDAKGLAARRCDASHGTALLLRPDQHVCARWRQIDAEAIEKAYRRATGHWTGH